MIRWFANNNIAANFLMLAILLSGGYVALNKIPLEVQPAKTYSNIRITMSYRGGTAKDVEQSVLIPIESALEGIEGIEDISAYGRRDYGYLWIDIDPDAPIKEILEDVKSRVDGITTFPGETEKPRIYIPDTSHWHEVLSVAVTGNLEEYELRRVAQKVQDDLTAIDGISRVSMEGSREYEVSVEANQEVLDSYNLGFRDISDAIRRFSLDLPAGSIDSDSGTLTVRTRGQAYTQEDFGNIPIRAANGAEVLLRDVAKVDDGFGQERVIARFNGENCMFLEVMRTGNENAIEISNKVKEYVRTKDTHFPEGINIYTWNDESISIRGRLSTLTWSLIQGSALVFILLGLFLRPQLAFWVMIGIPISFAGGVLFMPYFGITANVMSLFGFIIVVGVVVDDAIVTGENIYSKLKTGMDPLEASIVGAQEVAVPVTFGVLTTIVAFMALLFFDGQWGDFAKQIPPVVAPVLLFSLIESKLILPAHLKFLKTGRTKLNFFERFQKRIADGLETFVAKVYQPSLNAAVKHRYAVTAGFVAMALIMIGYCRGGRLGFVSMPTVDRLEIGAYLDMPHDTTIEKTAEHMDRVIRAIDQLKREFVDPGTGESLIQNVMTTVGGHWIGSRYDKDEGCARIEVTPPSLRTVPGPKNSEISARWKAIIGPMPEARSLRIRGERTGGGDDSRDEEAIEIELRGKSSPLKAEIAEQIDDLLETYDGIDDAWASNNREMDELEITLKPRAVEVGLTQQSLAQQVRQAFYGEEAQRILRDRDDIRVMVRLPRRERESMHTFDNLKVRTPTGTEVPLASVANVAFVKAPSRIERQNGSEVIEIFAQPANETVDIIGIAKAITPQIEELLQQDESLSFGFGGYIAEHEESKRKTIIGSIVLAFTLFALLAIPFKSMIQPIYVLVAVPFGIIGALLGHIIMDVTPSYLSVFGMLAMAGVVVNDSLVMVDFVNRKRAEGLSLGESVRAAGGARFRPIMLTSITTFVGLAPLLMDNSIQAQFLIPMAISLGFGVLFATLITLYLIPCALLLGEDFGTQWSRIWAWYKRPFESGTEEAA
ncbi:efflux RND transporter permease subunit [Verrucomicrobiales bacterium]|nr:efflux RND transporter permease subunit [Verrucomicrobiales bacterium]